MTISKRDETIIDAIAAAVKAACPGDAAKQLEPIFNMSRPYIRRVITGAWVLESGATPGSTWAMLPFDIRFAEIVRTVNALRKREDEQGGLRHHSVTDTRIELLARRSRETLDDLGICFECGAEAHGVEPDARNYECESCGERRVFGAEEALIMVTA